MPAFLRTNPPGLYPDTAPEVALAPKQGKKKPVVVMLTHNTHFSFSLETHASFVEHLDVRPLLPKSCLTGVPHDQIGEALQNAAWLVINPCRRSMYEDTQEYASEAFAVRSILGESCKTQLAILAQRDCIESPYMRNEKVWQRLKAVAHVQMKVEAFQAYPLAQQFDLYRIPREGASWSDVNDRFEMHKHLPLNIGEFAQTLARLAA